MRSVFPAEMYKDSEYRVVHGQEEQAQFERLGWTEDIPVEKKRSDYVQFGTPKRKGPASAGQSNSASYVAQATQPKE